MVLIHAVTRDKYNSNNGLHPKVGCALVVELKSRQVPQSRESLAEGISTRTRTMPPDI